MFTHTQVSDYYLKTRHHISEAYYCNITICMLLHFFKNDSRLQSFNQWTLSAMTSKNKNGGASGGTFGQKTI